MNKKLLFIFLVFITRVSTGQLLTWTPDFPTETTAGLVITMDASKGNLGLLNYNPTDVYVHIGVITNLSAGSGDWRHVASVWGTTDPAFKANPVLGSNKWTFTISADLRTYFNITDPNEKIQKIAILFRNGDGSKKQANADGSDMYMPVYTTTMAVRIAQPPSQPAFVPIPETITKAAGDNIAVTAIANKSSAMKLFLNGTAIQSAGNTTTISANPLLANPGNQQIVAEANDGVSISRDTISFYVNSTVNIAPLPPGVKPGINYINETSATLVLYAPGKNTISVIGDFPGSNWAASPAFQMNITPDSTYWWITLSGLEPGKEYSFQYLVDGSLRIADPYSEKILDPYNDQYISSATYPDLKPYPTGFTTEVVGILQTKKPQYQWSGKAYTRPGKENLIVYELLVRDFVEKHDWNTLRDTLNYLKRLGINAIEIMPFNEFEGNISWGYNPDFYFAPDKYYGPENSLKEFIDSCHSNGIAVVQDIALNHSFGMSPLVRLYWDGANNRPAINNPWFNPVPKHAYNVGYDMNHESAQTKYFVSRVVSFWMSEYKIDGFRFDLSKGFTQKQTCDNNGNNCDVAAWSAYDQSRIDIWKGYYDTLQKYNPGAYCILEHFADNSEEKVLSNYGMMLWGNGNYNYNQATMGYNTDWNFSGVLANVRGWSSPNLVSYMESHDEERLMYKNIRYGNSDAGYNIMIPDTALERQALAAAFFLTLPGPKMIWQFGELGYDYSINYCQDGTVNGNCRTDPKPIRWDYFQDVRRKKLYDTYRNLIRLRKEPSLISAFTSNTIDQDFSGAFKWLILNSASGKLVVIGNFDIISQTGLITFPAAGTWYDYFSGTTLTVTSSPQSFTLKPGEFRVFTNSFISLAIELKSFSGINAGDKNVLNWQITRSDNLAGFEVQRSEDGINFNDIGKVDLTNDTNYGFTDDNVASGKTWYYRLKITGRDGSLAWSNIVMLRSDVQEMEVALKPNPFSGVLKLIIQSPVVQTAELLIMESDGKQVLKKTLSILQGRNEIGIAETMALSRGVYVVRLSYNQKIITRKVVKL